MAIKKSVGNDTLREKIVNGYNEYVLVQGQYPESVYAFCKKIKIKEADFYQEFSSFAQVEAMIWRGIFDETLITTKAEAIYESYAVREKMLAFYYTWIEELKANRSYILKSYETLEKPIYLHKNAQFIDFKNAFYGFANELLLEAQETREIEQRPIPQIMQRYPDILWMKTMFILDFWINDTSKLFEKTDTLIEKSVNTVFDLLARSPLDALLDLGKFIYQNRK